MKIEIEATAQSSVQALAVFWTRGRATKVNGMRKRFQYSSFKPLPPTEYIILSRTPCAVGKFGKFGALLAYLFCLLRVNDANRQALKQSQAMGKPLVVVISIAPHHHETSLALGQRG